MKVKFVPQNIEFEIKPGQPVLHVAQDNNVHIKSVCRGVPSCAECRVRVVSGEHNVIPPSQTELGLIGTAYFVDGRRLSCQLRCFGDITVDLTEQVEKTDTSSKKIRGRSNKDEMEESRAVMGNLIMSDEPSTLEDPNITPVSALGPDGVPVSDEDEVDEAEDAHEAHMHREHAVPHREGGVETPRGPRPPQQQRPQQNRQQQNRQQAGGRPGGGQGGQSSGGGQGQPQGEGGGLKKRRRKRGGRGRRGGSGGGQGGGPGGGSGPSGGGGS